jgi:hypothetical protein
MISIPNKEHPFGKAYEIKVSYKSILIPLVLRIQ